MRFLGRRIGSGKVIRGLAACVIAPLLLAACTKNAATGKRIFAPMSLQDQAALGSEAAPQFAQEYGGPVPDAECQAYVREIGTRLAGQVEDPNFKNLPWEFSFLNSDVVNAFALPGGKVFFTRGLAARLTNEAQMAGVIGHEIGHVTAEHGAQRIGQQTLWNVGATVAAVVVESSGNERVRNVGAYGVPALQIGGNLVMLKYGRDEELEADRLGVRYMTRVGYDPKGQMQVMEVLQSLASGGGTPEILSTHPDPGKRIEQIKGMLAGEYASTQNNPQYQLKESEYRTKMLARLSRLAPAPKPAATGMVDIDGLGPSVLWCAHCREDAMHAAR